MSVEVLQSHQNLSRVESCRLDVKGSHLVNVLEELSVLGVGKDEVEAFWVLEGAVQLHEEGDATLAQSIENVPLSFDVFSLLLPDNVSLVTDFNWKKKYDINTS